MAGLPVFAYMNVKKNSMKISITFPPESQNSASPNAFTARMLIALHNVISDGQGALGLGALETRLGEQSEGRTILPMKRCSGFRRSQWGGIVAFGKAYA